MKRIRPLPCEISDCIQNNFTGGCGITTSLDTIHGDYMEPCNCTHRKFKLKMKEDKK